MNLKHILIGPLQVHIGRSFFLGGFSVTWYRFYIKWTMLKKNLGVMTSHLENFGIDDIGPITIPISYLIGDLIGPIT